MLMVNVIASSVVDYQNDHKIVIYCFSTLHAAFISKTKDGLARYNVSVSSDMSNYGVSQHYENITKRVDLVKER